MIGVSKKKSPLMAFSISHVTVLREEQLQKHLTAKLVTEDGILIESREWQTSKQPFPKHVTEDGITVVEHPKTMVLLSE